jgi:ABC-type antimicrobial peptide transport system permease subunit
LEVAELKRDRSLHDVVIFGGRVTHVDSSRRIRIEGFSLRNPIAAGCSVGACCERHREDDGWVGDRNSGTGLSWTLDRYELIKIPADVYQVAHVPFVVLPLDFAVVVLSAVVICFLATIYPSRQAAGLDPVAALRIE